MKSVMRENAPRRGVKHGFDYQHNTTEKPVLHGGKHEEGDDEVSALAHIACTSGA